MFADRREVLNYRQMLQNLLEVAFPMMQRLALASIFDVFLFSELVVFQAKLRGQKS
jgi:predicted SPOUT superfamily RNA methylase MTH1